MAKAKTPGGRRSGAQTSGTRAGGGASGATLTVDAPEPKKPRTSPMQFISQVRAEGRKVTWPSRKETWITSVMVFIMVIIAALFFWGADFALGAAFQRIIAIGR